MILALIIQHICKLISYLPLSWIKALARIFAFIIIHFSSRAYARVQTNLLLTNLANEDNVIKMAKRTVLEFANTLVEILFMVWTKRYKYCVDLVDIDVATHQVLKTAISCGKRILFLTPHLGNFELSVEYLTNTYKINMHVLYKPTKIKFLNYLMEAGMKNPYIKFCSVRDKKELLATIKNFKQGQYIGMLPDSIASQNNGVWVEFFDQQIFASSLAASLSLLPDTVVLIGACVRVGARYKFLAKQVVTTSQDKTVVMQQFYRNIEEMTKQYPEQYFWSYDRFRIPKYIK